MSIEIYVNEFYAVNQILHIVVSIEFSPLSTIDLTTNWYQWHNGDYEDRLQILEHSFGKQLPTNFLQPLLDTYNAYLNANS